MLTRAIDPSPDGNFERLPLIVSDDGIGFELGKLVRSSF
jgi:hypothetical protein